MSGKLKIRVDQDKCQGHARCKSLAPELFDLDEFGNAHEIGDGIRARRPGRQGVARADQLPGNRDRSDRGVVQPENRLSRFKVERLKQRELT